MDRFSNCELLVGGDRWVVWGDRGGSGDLDRVVVWEGSGGVGVGSWSCFVVSLWYLRTRG